MAPANGVGSSSHTLEIAMTYFGRPLAFLILILMLGAAGAVLAAEGAAVPAPSATALTATASPDPSTQPARGPRGAGRGAGAANPPVQPLTDAQTVDLTPPLDKNGNFKITP